MDSSLDVTADEETIIPEADDDDGEESSFLFVEAKETFRCIDGLKNTETQETCLNRLREIWDKYLECPTLLDPFLEKMVQELTMQVNDALLRLHPNAATSTLPLTDIGKELEVMEHAADDDDDAHSCIATMTMMNFPLTALYALSKVRGYKYIQRFLPHGVDQLEPIWATLQLLLCTRREAALAAAAHSPSSSPSSSCWESVYMLWHWMSVLSLIPFDCKVFTTVTAHFSENDDDDNVSPPPLPFMDALMKMAQEEFQQSGPVREAAATCLAAWLSRPDWEEAQLPKFIQWTKTVVEEYTTGNVAIGASNSSSSNNFGSSVNLFRVMGALQTCTAILKGSSASRQHLITHMQELWYPLVSLADWQQVGGGGGNNLLLRKLLVKFWTRMGCAYLPPRIAAWRYQRGKRSLEENLQCKPQTSSTEQAGDTAENVGAAADENEDLCHVPDLVEDAMGRVLESLCHSSTIVRWSAAKGIGRMTERLPSVCAEDILDALLKCFECVEKDQSWHGACLALAELARRGLLLPRRLGDVVPLIVRAIQYDQHRGQTSVGAHVRDAACYTYWAFARAYNPSLLQPFLKELSEAIVLVSLFDREVNCRRAASAAFQEAVGRQPAASFPNGIAILTKADYFSLGNRGDAYMHIAKSIAVFEEFRQPIMSHLFTVKLFHWDIAIRTLASLSLANMAALDPRFLGFVAIPLLLSKSLDDKNLYARHGAVLGVAEITLALAKLGVLDSSMTDETRTDIIALVSLIEKNRLYRGRGGEIMRSAVCRLIECISIARMPLVVKDQVRLLDSADASIPHPSEEIQQCACRALEQLLAVYFPVRETGPSPRLQARVVDKFVNLLETSNNVAVTRGYALALGSLPPKLLAPNRFVLDSIMSCLFKAAHPNAVVAKEGDAETRRNALISLIRIAKVVPWDSSGYGIYPLVPLQKDQLSSLFDTFFRSLGDYKRDRRGDVGSWCRIAAMEGLTDLLRICKHSARPIQVLGRSIATAAVCEVLKQLSEKLDNVRMRAAHCLLRILLDGDISGIDHQAELIEAMGLDPLVECNWADPGFVFPKVVQILSITCRAERTVDGVTSVYCYRDSIISGLVISVGDLTESVSKQASIALLGYAKLMRGTPELQSLSRCLLSLMQRHRGDGRVMLPLLKTLNKLFSNQCLDFLVATDDEFAESCLQNLQNEERICSDVHRLLAIADVAAALLSSSPKTKVERKAIAFLCLLMGHAFPRVRDHTSQQLYVVLLNRTEQPPSGAALHDLVLNTPWASDLDDKDIRRAVDEISIGLGVDGFLVPMMPQATV